MIVLERLKLRGKYDGFLFLAESRRNPPILKPHHHAELELNLVVAGSVTYVVAGNRHTFPRGSLLWLFPEQEHQLVNRTPDAGYYVAVFKPRLIEQACHGGDYEGLKRKNIKGGGVLNKMLDPGTFDLVKRTMDSLMEDSLDPDLLNREAGFGFQSDFRFEHGDPDVLNAGLRYLLVLCWRHFHVDGHSERPVKLHPAVVKALQMLTDSESALPELAARCGVSDTYLSRLFRKQVGVPMTQYRNAHRLGRFMELHEKSPRHRTILESIYDAGFGSYAQFYKVFTAAYGKGPRDYLARRLP